jgi:hypothetical protein
MTVRYDESGYLKIVLIFLQAGGEDKLSQAGAEAACLAGENAAFSSSN